MHVEFVGADTLDTGSDKYSVSFPLDVCLNTLNDFIIAYEMNGLPLTLDHGAPIWLVAPGYLGFKSVKWLTKIIVKGTESCGYI